VWILTFILIFEPLHFYSIVYNFIQSCGERKRERERKGGPKTKKSQTSVMHLMHTSKLQGLERAVDLQECQQGFAVVGTIA
jgi:hypothetical protein